MVLLSHHRVFQITPGDCLERCKTGKVSLRRSKDAYSVYTSDEKVRDARKAYLVE